MVACIYMPEVSANMEMATIVSWNKATGDSVSKGECVAEIETDKAVIEIESPSTGFLGEILVAAGQSAAVGAIVGVVTKDPNETVDWDAILKTEKTLVPPEQIQGQSAEKGLISEEKVDIAEKTDRHFSSPVARKMAREAGVLVESIPGTGPKGRVIKRDVIAYLEQTSSSSSAVPALQVADEKISPSSRVVPHSAMRRTIAQRLVQSKATIPHFYLRADCNVEALVTLREQINLVAPTKVSMTDLLIKIVAISLKQHPDMNVMWTDEALIYSDDVDIAVAVSTETGLLTPVIKAAQHKTVSEVSAEITKLAQQARSGRLQPAQYQGGSITISNLGMYEVEEFSAIINPPQAVILAVGAIQAKPIVDEQGELAIAKMMTVTLSVDHRAIDGALAAEWLRTFKRLVERPLASLI